jgi:hypothetical protein
MQGTWGRVSFVRICVTREHERADKRDRADKRGRSNYRRQWASGLRAELYGSSVSSSRSQTSEGAEADNPHHALATAAEDTSRPLRQNRLPPPLRAACSWWAISCLGR